jgi:hypothetical protein
MRTILLLSILTLSACTSSRTENMTRPETVRIVAGSGGIAQLSTVTSDASNAVTVDLPTDQVWRVLPAVYESLGIPVGQLDASTRVIGNPSLKVRRRLGDVPLTRYYNCRSTQGGANAETYELHLSVLTRVAQSAAEMTTVSTAVQATGRPVSFAGDPVRCTSTGALEARIVEALKAQAQR